jgi:hypothetical protein
MRASWLNKLSTVILGCGISEYFQRAMPTKMIKAA